MAQSLAAKLALRISVFVVALLLLGGASVWGLQRLARHFDAAEDQYAELRAIYEIGHHVAAARSMVRLDEPRATEVRLELDRALRAAQLMLEDAETEDAHRPALQQIAALLREARQIAAPLPQINQALTRVADLADRTKQQILANRAAASSHLRLTMIAMGVLTALIALGVIVIGAVQYRSIVMPLRRLESSMRRVAETDFTQRVPLDGDREFVQLAGRFNRMAEELEAVYRDLEQQVLAKSRQLVRSERLASLGYLAAGVAHEINNPLGIICGYAESALRRLQRHADAPPEKTADALRVICEEAMRCKDITTKLLTLARPGDEGRTAVDLAALARRVTSIVTGLPQFARRTVDVVADDHAALTVDANEAELTQVALNLVCNALEAANDAHGRVDVRVARRGRRVELSVVDNGRGIDEATLGRIFEPFYTDKPARGERGIGLGLSIAHAIAEQHGGALRAESPGPGRGSTFTLELPAADAATTDAPNLAEASHG